MIELTGNGSVSMSSWPGSWVGVARHELGGDTRCIHVGVISWVHSLFRRNSSLGQGMHERQYVV